MAVKRLISTFCLMFVASCSSIASVAQVKSDSKPESLYGVALFETQIEFKVRNNGCTKPSDFEVRMDNTENEVSLRVDRVKPDLCRKMPSVISVTKSLDYSDTKPNLPIKLINPLRISRQ